MRELYVNYKKIREIIDETYEGESAPANPTGHKAMKILEVVDEAYAEHIEELPIYVTICERWGSDENHSYFRGTFRSLEHAVADALEHFDERGGKYYPKIYKDSFSGSPELVFDYGEYESKKIDIIRNRED